MARFQDKNGGFCSKFAAALSKTLANPRKVPTLARIGAILAGFRRMQLGNIPCVVGQHVGAVGSKRGQSEACTCRLPACGGRVGPERAQLRGVPTPFASFPDTF